MLIGEWAMETGEVPLVVAKRVPKAGESALFAADLLRMYLRYAERRGWKTEVIDATFDDGRATWTVRVRAGGALYTRRVVRLE